MSQSEGDLFRSEDGRRAAIMQPYFLPYIGYFQLVNAVDVFVLYDNIKYTKKGWINRNRILVNGGDDLFTLPLKADSDFAEIGSRQLAEDFRPEKLLNRLRSAYRRAPCFREVFPLLERILRHADHNLFAFNYFALEAVCRHLGITTPLVVSSTLPVDSALRSQDRVLATCEAVRANTYLNPIGGTALYAPQVFAEQRLRLRFLKADSIEYPQFGAPFVPSLSIIDVMMFIPAQGISTDLLYRYSLL